MTTKNNQVINDLTKIKYDFNSGKISYDTAKTLAKPLLYTLNAEMAIIYKRHNKKPIAITFTGFMR
ncbi:MAG: hypothetical protein WCJ60_04340 [bacterium]